MRLKAVKLKNFRSYRGDTPIMFDDLTALVGRNDVGKSTVLDALGVFFDCKLTKFDISDQCVHADDNEVRIGCVFTELPETLVLDQNAETSLADEHLLNVDGDLEIHRVWNISNGKKSESVVAVARHPTARGVADLLQKKNTELKGIADGFEINDERVDRRANPSLRKAIWATVDDLALQDVEVPLKNEDAKRIWEKLQAAFPTFALFRADRPSTDEEDEVQDPMKLAVKEALRGLDAELESIKGAVQQKALVVAQRTVKKLEAIAPEIARELKPNFKAEPKWDGIFKLSLTSDEQIPINKRGSGVRRLVLLSFFRAEAERKRDEEGRQDIIYAIEEPETSQHPENQQMLIDALLRLSSEDGCQVVLSTHVPALAGMVPIEGIRYISMDDTGLRTIETGTDSTMKRVADELGVLPDERVRVLVCVEGPNDVAFLKNIADVLRRDDPDIVDLRSDPRVVVLPLGGSTLQDWVNHCYLKPLGKPEVHIYDRDEGGPPKYQAACDSVNSRSDGSQAFLTAKREVENYLHEEAIFEAIGIRVAVDDVSDIPCDVAKTRHEARNTGREWVDVGANAKKKCVAYAKRLLNEDAAARMTTSRLDDRAATDEVRSWLVAIAGHINR